MINNAEFLVAFNAPQRTVGARVELFEGETLAHTFLHTDALKSFTVERIGEESKFFGFGVCQKLNLKLIDLQRAINITTAHTLKASYSVDTSFLTAHPLFDVVEVNRDENTNEIDVTAYDAIYKASGHTVAELELTAYTIQEFATACANILGLQISFSGIEEATLETAYAKGANFDGSETIREALNAVAEATQSIYFVTQDNVLCFKRLDATAVASIPKSQYFTLKSGESRTLATIAHVTELGDNVSATSGEGVAQYVRNNPLWELREDVATLVDNALAAVGGLTINQFECSWRGNPLLEVGDRVGIVTKDDSTIYSYILNDVIEYSGYLKGTTQWNYTESESESSTNPTNLGEALKQTFARVDKVNQQIEMVVNGEDGLSALRMNVFGITSQVTEIEKKNIEALGNLNESVAELTKTVETSMTAEAVQFLVKEELTEGVDKVTTSTGFTFDENGLKITKTDSEMSTEITEDGMKVKREDETVLTADNGGVIAKNLHANTFLIIGQSSRFEDYEKSGETRTGCFWIGG